MLETVLSIKRSALKCNIKIDITRLMKFAPTLYKLARDCFTDQDISSFCIQINYYLFAVIKYCINSGIPLLKCTLILY